MLSWTADCKNEDHATVYKNFVFSFKRLRSFFHDMTLNLGYFTVTHGQFITTSYSSSFLNLSCPSYIGMCSHENLSQDTAIVVVVVADFILNLL